MRLTSKSAPGVHIIIHDSLNFRHKNMCGSCMLWIMCNHLFYCSKLSDISHTGTLFKLYLYLHIEINILLTLYIGT